MAAVLVEPHRVRSSRQLVTSWVLRGQRKIHFVSESHTRRRQILTSIAESPALALRTATRPGKDEAARAAALTDLSFALLDAGVVDLILESRGDARDAHDRRTLSRLRVTRPGTLAFRHTPGHDEPMLWVADACAWSAGAGGRYRSAITTMLGRP